MNLYQYRKIKDGIFNNNEQMTSQFVFQSSEKTVLMDTGMDFMDLKKQIQKKTGREDIMVVNSHFHPDHSNGNHNFDTVYIGEKDLPTFTTEDTYFKLVDDISSAIYEKVEKKRGGKILKKLLEKAVDKALMTKKGNTSYLPLKDGDVLDLGDKKLLVKDFPGHTPGSITLLDPADKLIFAGDACNMGFWAFTNPELNLHEYAETERAYYREVKKAGYKKMYGSHVPFPNKISFIKDNAKFMDKLTPEKALIRISVPGGKSKLCIAMRPSRHLMYGCFYWAHQCEQK